jgi:hypothetical protein
MQNASYCFPDYSFCLNELSWLQWLYQTLHTDQCAAEQRYVSCNIEYSPNQQVIFCYLSVNQIKNLTRYVKENFRSII